MDDSLKTLDLSAEGTVSVPPVVETPPAPQPTIVTQSSGPTDKKPMGKKTKIVAGVLSVLVLLSGLGVGIFLSRQKQLSAIKAGGPNICTWETCGDDPNKWAAGAAAAEGKAQENPAVAAQVQEIVNTAINTNDNGSVGNQVDHIEAVLNTNLDQQEKQALGNILTTTQQQALSGALAPVTIASGPTLSVGAGGVQVVRTGGCADCGGLNQGGCDNNPTSKGGVAGPACGFGCVGGLSFCTSSGSCQASCPDGKVSAGPASSNPAAFACLTTGVGCGTGGATGLTKLPTTSGGTVTGKFPGTDAVTNLFTANRCTTSGGSNGYLCADWSGKSYCSGDAEKMLGLTVGSTRCNVLLEKLAGKDYTWGGRPKTSNTYTSSPQVINGKVVWDTTMLTAIYGSLGFTKPLIWDFNNGVFDAQSLRDFLNVLYEGASNKNAAWVINLWSCPTNTSLSGGCNTGTPRTFSNQDVATGTVGFNSSQCGVQQIDIDTPTGHISFNYFNENCGTTTTTTTTNTPTGGTNPSPSNPPSGSNPTPTPTTTTQSYACYQLSIMKNGNNISAASVQVGDSLVMRGFATATNTTVSKMRFIVSINGVAQAPVDVNTSLISGMYQADMPYTITQVASYSVTTTPISP